MDEMVIHYDHRVDKLEKLSMFQILQLNNRERRDRSFSLKVHNFIDYSIAGQHQLKHIFDTILKPSMEDAFKKGELEEVPASWHQAIEYGHSLNSKDASAPQNYIIRMRSRFYLNAILRFKGPHVKDLNERNKKASKSYAEAVQAGKFYPCRVGNDVTSLDKEVLSWLCRHHEVNRAYSRVNKVPA